MPKISVLIPSYNHEKYIGEAIESVLMQTYQDFELIIVDDGSTDQSVEVIQRYQQQDARIHFIKFEQNLGACSAAARLIEEAQGEYLAVLSSDDLFIPNKLEKQLNFLENNSQYKAVFSYAEMIDENGNPFVRQDHFYTKIFIQPNRNRFDWLRYFFYHGNCLCHSSVLIKKECYEKIGVYDYRYFQLPDFDFWIRLCMQYEIFIISENLVKFRIRANEENASGDNYTNQIRYRNELVSVLQRYRAIQSKKVFLRIFPQAGNYLQISDTNLEYALAMVCLEKTNSIMHRSFGLNLLFEILGRNDKKFTDEHINIFKKLYDLSKKNDIFSVCLVDIFCPEVFIKKYQLLECEKQEIEIEQYGNSTNIRIRVSDGSNIEKIILYPLKGWRCKCSIHHIYTDAKKITLNQKSCNHQVYEFLDKEPVFIFEGDFEGASLLEVSYEIKLFGLHDILQVLDQLKFNNEALSKQNQNFVFEKNNLLSYQKDLEKEIARLNLELNRLNGDNRTLIEKNMVLSNKNTVLNNKNVELENTLYDIYNSRGYKLLSKYRHLREKIKKY